MSSRTTLGLDWIDLLIHIGATIFLMIVAVSVGEEMIGGPPTEALMGLVGAASLILLAYRRRRALAAAPPDDTGAVRVADMEDRLAALEHGHERIFELEERLEFAERLLAQHQQPDRIPGT
jgi:Zn-dependent protease with chaperone function